MRVPLFLLVMFFSAAASAFQASPVHVADAGCANCHAKIFQSYLDTPMARASGTAADNLVPGSFLHAPSGMEYTISKSSSQASLSYQSKQDPQISGKHALAYFLGSGHLGTTYLYQVNGYLFESPVAWYAASGGYDMKPGLAAMKTATPSLPMESGCLRCHMSGVQHSDAGTLNRYSGLPFLHTGITCEACHGDAQHHAATLGKAPVVNPASLDPDRRDSVCISCHLEGDVSVERAEHSALDYRPGDSISDYVAFYVYTGNNLMDRGVSEVEQLAQSTCKRMSGDNMSCTSCHDPHFTPPPEQRVAFFRSKCLACHSQPQFAATHHPENPDCTSCHMRHTGAQNIPHVAWTDHRILRVPPATPPDGMSPQSGDLTAIFSPGATKRDLAMAYYQSLLEGNPSAEPRASSLFEQQRTAIANDPKALDAFGNLSAERGDNKNAEDAFRQVLKLEPHDLTALSNLGILQARQGELQQAISSLQPAFERNQDIAGLAMNLARIQCMAGDAAGARSTLDTALIYNPALQDLQTLRGQLANCTVPARKGTTQ